MDIENINENEESEREELESESIRVPINNAETNQYDKTIFLKGTNLYSEQSECNKENIQTLIDNYVNIPEKMKDQYFERDSQAIRWKYDNNQPVSNAKLIEWSDGTYNIQIGNELYDLALGDVNDLKVFSVYRNTLLIAQSALKQKAICKNQKNKMNFD